MISGDDLLSLVNSRKEWNCLASTGKEGLLTNCGLTTTKQREEVTGNIIINI